MIKEPRKNFNPRSPWGERLNLLWGCTILAIFQSALPVGGATSFPPPVISLDNNFNPRSPWGERPASAVLVASMVLFQSALPVGGATPGRISGTGRLPRISIRAPRGGSDTRRARNDRERPYFNPRSPWGERRFILLSCKPAVYISIRAPRGGSDSALQRSSKRRSQYFNPRSPWGERQPSCPAPRYKI